MKLVVNMHNNKEQVFERKPSWKTLDNFVYGLSRRENEKITNGLNLMKIIFKGLTDKCIQDCEFEPAEMKKSEIFKTIVDTIKIMDKVCVAGMNDYAVLMCGIYNKPMTVHTREISVYKGWTVKYLKRNPYVVKETQ